MPSEADEIIRLYERHTEVWDRNRVADLILEREWMERFVALLPSGGSVLNPLVSPVCPLHKKRVTGKNLSPFVMSWWS